MCVGQATRDRTKTIKKERLSLAVQLRSSGTRITIALIDPFGRATKIAYGDQLGGCMSCGNAAVDLPISITDPLTGVTSFKYDALGNLTNVTDALTHSVGYGYDAMNRLTSRTDQLGNAEVYRYDKHGNLTNFVDRRSASIVFNYDVLERRTSVVYAANDSVRYFYDTVGRITNVNDSIAGNIGLAYDPLDRLTQVIDINGTLTYAYNDLGLRTNMTVAGQTAVAYFYDPANRLTNVVQGTVTSSLSYEDDGRRTKLVLPNGINVLYNYDVASRLTSIVFRASSTNYIAYGYDSAGNRASQAGGFSVYNLPSAVPNSLYDVANHQMTFGAYNLLYDLNGNVTSIINGTTTNTLLWSARNQLTNMLGAVTATFAYDGLGRRITRSIGGTTEKYAYDGLDIIQQLNNTGAISANYFRSLGIDEPWQRIDIGTSNTNRTYLADGLGSIIALADSSKNISNQYAYEPFGATTTTGPINKNSCEFTSRENDGTGLYYYRARYYHPAIGRFVSEDPLDFFDGPNGYTYTINDPLDSVDSLGLSVSLDCLAKCVEQYRNPVSEQFPRWLLDRLLSTQPDPNITGAIATGANVANAIGNLAVGPTGPGGIAGVASHATSWQHVLGSNLGPWGSRIGRFAGRAALATTVFDGFFDLGLFPGCAIACENCPQ